MTWVFSEAAWRLIPPLTSAICLVGFLGAMELLGIARRDKENHSRDARDLQMTAKFLQRRAQGRAMALGLLVCSGILFAVGTWNHPIPPKTGVQIALWVNHYLVGTVGTILTALALLDRRDRLKL